MAPIPMKIETFGLRTSEHFYYTHSDMYVNALSITCRKAFTTISFFFFKLFQSYYSWFGVPTSVFHVFRVENTVTSLLQQLEPYQAS